MFTEAGTNYRMRGISISFRNRDGFVLRGHIWITRAAHEDPEKVAVKVFDLASAVLTGPYILNRDQIYTLDSVPGTKVFFRRKFDDPFLKAIIQAPTGIEVVRERAFIRNSLMGDFRTPPDLTN